jgi:signal transduction histidine kinase
MLDDRLDASQEMNHLLLQTLFHDLGSPLATVTAAAGLLRDRIDDREVLRILEVVDGQLDRMQQLLTTLRHLDQAEQRDAVTHPEPLDLATFAAQHLEHVELLGRRLERDLAPVHVEVDPLLLGRAVANLLRNAVEHTPDGSTIWVRTARSDGGPRTFVVEDDGHGLPDDVAALFEPYRRGDRNGSVGLGLSLADRYVRAAGGQLTAGQRPGGGARFVIELPATAPPATA